jgi:uncharacterized membrane protein SpoIIM required for sporulation
MFWGTYSTLWWAVAGLIVLAILLMRIGLAHFQREELLGREIDVLNVRWMWKIFTRTFSGGAKNIHQWYGSLIKKTIPEMRIAIVITALLGLAGFLIGSQLIHDFFLKLDAGSMNELEKRTNLLIKAWPILSMGPVLAIWWQNTRVMLLAMLLGNLSMGILGVMPFMFTLGLMGYLMNLLVYNGLPVLQYFSLLLPHGIIEVPAVILGTAAVLHTGAILGTPTPNKTIGEVWLTALANWVKVMVGVVVPLLLIAAMVEAWLTPRIALMFIH